MEIRTITAPFTDEVLKSLKVGDIVKVIVLSVDEKRHRISLSMKQVKK